ncbi:hypothetical protein ABZX51_005440 [Aspergillus tubingensis]
MCNSFHFVDHVTSKYQHRSRRNTPRPFNREQWRSQCCAKKIYCYVSHVSYLVGSIAPSLIFPRLLPQIGSTTRNSASLPSTSSHSELLSFAVEEKVVDTAMIHTPTR